MNAVQVEQKSYEMPPREGISIGQSAIHVAVGLGLVSGDVFRAQEYLEGAVSADESGQPSHGTAAGDQTDRHLPLRQDRLFPAGEAHVAGQGDFAAVSRRPSPDRGDRHDGRPRQAHKDIRPGFQPGRPLRKAGQVLEPRVEIAVVQEKSVDGAVKDNDPHLLVRLEPCQDLPELHYKLRTHEVQRWVVECDPAITW